MGLLASISDLVTKRALKFLLKRNFGKYLANELDQDSFDVQLGKGSIELKRLLLNCAQLNSDLVSLAAALYLTNSTMQLTTVSCNQPPTTSPDYLHFNITSRQSS